MSKDSRDRMVRSAASLIQRRGATATSFSEVIEASGAPRGSIYHHFPKGKEQLHQDAIQWVFERSLSYLRQCNARTPAGVLDHFFDLWRQAVVASGGTAGCVVAGVAVDTLPDSEVLMATVRSTFQAFIDVLAEQLRGAGMPGARARSVATAALAGMEGALILCRAERSVAPLDAVAKELSRLVARRA